MNKLNNFTPYGFYYFSNTHLKSAIIFAKEAKNKEKTKVKSKRIICGELTESEHSSYVISSLIMSVAYLESLINEIFTLLHYEKEEGYANSFIKGINQQDIEKISNKERYSTIEKYDYILELICNEKIKRGTELYDNINILIKLRNYFVHYKPEIIYMPPIYDLNKEEIANIGKKLKGKFNINPYVADNSPFFPDKCISFNCANWGLKTVINFTIWFTDKIGWHKYGEYTKKDIIKIFPEIFT